MPSWVWGFRFWCLGFRVGRGNRGSGVKTFFLVCLKCGGFQSVLF